MHLGLIGGIGPAATEYYYRNLLKNGTDVALTITHARISALLENQATGAHAAQAAIFAAHVAKLKAAGAEVAAVTSVAGHFCHRELAAISPLPLVSILDVLEKHFAAHGIDRIGLIGSTVAMESKLFGAISTAEIIVPDAATLQPLGQAYGAMAHRGSVTAEEAEICRAGARSLIEDKGVDAVLLGGTDLYLVFGGTDPGFPVIDAADLHIAELDRIMRG
ncbi:MAG: aspartate/glutamate racemase family protein [Pseudomonadota bacterium]